MPQQVLDATEDELNDLISPEVERPQRFVAVDANEDELKGLIPVEQPDPSIREKLVGRFMGTDVDDQLELTRTGALVVGGFAGGIAMGQYPELEFGTAGWSSPRWRRVQCVWVLSLPH